MSVTAMRPEVTELREPAPSGRMRCAFDPRLKILHCIGTLEVGGEQRYLGQVTSRLDPQRFEQIVAFAGEADGAAAFFAPHVRLVRVLERKVRATAPRAWPTVARYVELVRREQPDLLTTHGPGPWHFAAAATARLLGRPTVQTIQRAFGNRSRGEDLTLRAWPLRRVAYAPFDRFVALGAYYAADQAERWRIPRHRIALIPIGIDLDQHAPSERLRRVGRSEIGADGDDLVLGIVARLVPVKGVDRGLRVLAATALIAPDVRLVVVGDGPSRGALEALAADLGIRERVTFVGASVETRKWFNAFDAYVQTTHNPLNGITSIEAMATGKPVITVVEHDEDRRMAADTCMEGENGFYVSLGALQHDAGRVVRALAAGAGVALGARSLQMARERFDLRDHVRGLEDLYVSLVRSRLPDRARHHGR